MDEVQTAYELLSPHIPEGTTLTIEQQVFCGRSFYIVRLLYTSKASGRTMCMTAKGQELPTRIDSTFNYYLRQIYLTPREVAKEFHRRQFRERVARQDAFLNSGYTAHIKVSTESVKDRMNFEEVYT